MELYASFAGMFLDPRHHSDHPALSTEQSVGYPAGNTLADAARPAGLNGIIYPSVRRPSGTCLAALTPHAVQSVAEGDVYRLTWCGRPDPVIEKVAT